MCCAGNQRKKERGVSVIFDTPLSDLNKINAISVFALQGKFTFFMPVLNVLSVPTKWLYTAITVLTL